MSERIVILEGAATNPGDLSWENIASLGELTIHENSSQVQLVERSKDATILITNKLKLGREELEQLPHLQLICQLATGYDNIDFVAARSQNILVCNAVGYGTHAVAQHVFALLLESTNLVAAHNNFVQEGGWSKAKWSHSLSTLTALNGLTMGIYGYGKIGQQVGVLAKAFGMNIIINTRSLKKHNDSSVNFVSLEKLFSSSDVVSIHAPLSKENKEVVNQSLLQLLKPNAILINTGRGGLINELDLRKHLISHPRQVALLDVLSQEPPPANHPLIGLNNCIITPHNAWAARAARARLLEIVEANIQAFQSGNAVNVVN